MRDLIRVGAYTTWGIILIILLCIPIRFVRSSRRAVKTDLKRIPHQADGTITVLLSMVAIVCVIVHLGLYVAGHLRPIHIV